MFNVNDRVIVVLNTEGVDTKASEFVGHTGRIIGERKYSSFRWRVEFDDESVQQKSEERGYTWKNEELILLDSDNKDYVR